MPHKTAITASARTQQIAKAERARRILTGATLRRDDSDDELGLDDLPWQWVYAEEEEDVSGEENNEAQEPSSKGKRGRPSRKVSKVQERKIVGAKMGQFECKVGDCILLKADSNEAWAGIICDFLEEDEEMGITVMC
jgi:origin recognition complex subunit 1